MADGLRIYAQLASAPDEKVVSLASCAIAEVRRDYPSSHVNDGIYHLLQDMLSACRERGCDLTLERLTESLVDEDNPIGLTIQAAVFDESLRSFEAACDNYTSTELLTYFPSIPEGTIYDDHGAVLLNSFLNVYCRARRTESETADLPTECWKQMSCEMRRRYSKGFSTLFSFPSPGTTVGTGYHLDEIVGIGGMAVVYRAMHRDGFRVALKLCRPDCPDRDRFTKEARDTVQLVDSLFVLVKDADLSPTTPCPYFTMNLVDGGKTFLDFLDPCDSEAADILVHFFNHSDTRKSLTGYSEASKKQRLTLMVLTLAHICDGLHRLHSAGYVHCDLKPSNILVSRKNGPLISDLGLAKALTNEASVPEPFSGTPEYASPEQAAGARLTPRSDIYQLGAILYRGLAGQPPYSKSTVEETLIAVIHEEVPRRRPEVGSFDCRIEAICRKALSRVPERRYVSAVELGEDLRRYLRGEPVLAREGFWWRRAVYHGSRSRAMWITLTLLVTVFIVGRITWLTRETIEGSVASQNRYQHPRTSIPVNAKLESRLDWPSPDYKDIIFIRSSILFDLTFWKPIPVAMDPGCAGRIEPCYFTRIVDLVLKENPRSESKTVVFQYRTEGADVDIMSSSHRYSVRGSDGRTILGGSASPVLVREVEVDLTNEPRGKEIRVVIHGTAWNGFQPKEGKTWAAFLAPEGLSLGEVAIRFSKKRKPREMPRLLVFPRGKRESVTPAGTQNFYSHPRDPCWVWRPDGILADHVYMMEWRWDP